MADDHVRDAGDAGYDSGHGDAGRVLRPDQGQQAALPASTGPSLVPGVEELCELNRSIHADDGCPAAYALDQRAPLLSCLSAAEEIDTSTPEGVVRAAAALAHGIARSQSFRDGNRRTAFFATQAFLERHGLAYISVGDDDMLTRYLNQVVERQSGLLRRRPPGPEKFEELFLRRLRQRTRPSGGD